jgi:hypothetical protein
VVRFLSIQDDGTQKTWTHFMPRMEFKPTIQVFERQDHRLRPCSHSERSIRNVCELVILCRFTKFHVQNTTHLNITNFMAKGFSWEANTAVNHVFKKFLAFMKPQSSLACSQKPDTVSYHVRVQSNPHFHIMFLHFNIILQSTPTHISKFPINLIFPTKTIHVFLIYPMRSTCVSLFLIDAITLICLILGEEYKIIMKETAYHVISSVLPLTLRFPDHDI